MAKSSTGMDENVAGLLCYLLGWVTGLIFFLIEKDSKFVRYHAIQSMVVFGFIFVVSMILQYIPFIGPILAGLIGLLGIILWIILMVNAYQGKKLKIAGAGSIAEKHA